MLINNLFIKNKIPYQIFIGMVVIILSLILRSINLFIIALSLVILYKMLSQKINKTIFNSKLFAITLILFSYIVLLQCAVLISWVINHNFPLSWTPLLLLGFILIMFFYNYLFIKKRPETKTTQGHYKLLNVQDILSLVVASIILGLVVLPPITQTTDYTKSAALISIVNGNSDDSSHIALINDGLHFDRGITYRSDSENKVRMDGFYPAGWPSVSAVLTKAFYPTAEAGLSGLVAYTVQKLFWFFVLIYLLTRVSFATFQFIGDRSHKTTPLFWVSTASFLLSYIFLIPIFQYGFYSLFPQLIAVLLVIPAIFQLSEEKEDGDTFNSLPLILILILGGCLSWFLPLPAFLLTALLILLTLAKSRKIHTTIMSIYSLIKENFILLIIILMATITQLYCMLNNHSGNQISFLKGILLDGGIAKYNSFFYLFIGIGFLTCLILANKKAIKNINFILYLMTPILLFCAYIYLIQIINIEKNAYYYYKMLAIFTIAVLPFCVTGYGLIINKIADYNKFATVLTLSVIFLVASFLMIGIDNKTLKYSIGERNLSHQMDHVILNDIKNNITQSNYLKKRYTFYYVPDPAYILQDTILGVLAKSNEQNTTCYNHVLWYTLPKVLPIDLLLGDIANNCNGYFITLVTDRSYQKLFEETVKNMALSNSILIRSY